MHLYNFTCVVRRPSGVYDTTLSALAANESDARKILSQRAYVITVGDLFSVDGVEIA